MKQTLKLSLSLVIVSALISTVFGAVAIRKQTNSSPSLAMVGCSGDAADDGCAKDCYFSPGLTEYVRFPTSDFGKCGSPCKNIRCNGSTYSDSTCTTKNGNCHKDTRGCLPYE